jgi:RNase P subunit RPR2
MTEGNWVFCPKCGRKLAQIVNGVLTIKEGKKEYRIYGGICVGATCDRCGSSFDLPLKMPVSLEDSRR